ncbi:MAG TPA: LysR substrate-binding domain-containing protein [Polyangiaceae bacterium]|nr:LysR substrate-binding domain-containing protein [Polyangiaceae bacterium]
MNAEPVSWDDLRIFLAMHRKGSQGGAARLLQVAHTTIGRRIAALEAALGARLFDRTPAGMALTDMGTALLPRAARVESEVLAAERDLRGADVRLEGSVRITASDGIVHYILLPALAELRRAHPGIAIEVRAETRELDLSRREADVALRLSRPKEPSLVARRLGTLRFGLYASRAYLERRGSPRSVADLAGHDFIGFDASLDELPQVRWLRKTVPSARASKGIRWAVRATTTTAQVVACAESQGIALLGTFVAPREARLVPVLPRLSTPSRETWLAVHQDVRPNARVGAVCDWLVQAMSAPATKQ